MFIYMHKHNCKINNTRKKMKNENQSVERTQRTRVPQKQKFK